MCKEAAGNFLSLLAKVVVLLKRWVILLSKMGGVKMACAKKPEPKKPEEKPKETKKEKPKK